VLQLSDTTRKASVITAAVLLLPATAAWLEVVFYVMGLRSVGRLLDPIPSWGEFALLVLLPSAAVGLALFGRPRAGASRGWMPRVAQPVIAIGVLLVLLAVLASFRSS
jgi:hypothetical protein